MIGLSGIEHIILDLGQGGYTPDKDGPWWLRLMYSFGLLDRYIMRLRQNRYLLFSMPDINWDGSFSWVYTTTHEGEILLLDYWLMSF